MNEEHQDSHRVPTSNPPPVQPTNHPRSAVGSEARTYRPRVRFTPGGETLDEQNRRASFEIRDDGPSGRHSHMHAASGLNPANPRSEDEAGAHEEGSHLSSPSSPLPPRPRPLVRHSNSLSSEHDAIGEQDEDAEEEKLFSQLAAQERAHRVSMIVGSHSAPVSAANSPRLSAGTKGFSLGDIPLLDLNAGKTRHGVASNDSSDDESDRPKSRTPGTSTAEAHQLVRTHTRRNISTMFTRRDTHSGGLRSGATTPVEDRDTEYVPPPPQYRGGVLSSLLKLYHMEDRGMHSAHGISRTASPSPSDTPPGAGAETPRTKHEKWYTKSPNRSTTSLAGLIGTSVLAAPGMAASTAPLGKRPSNKHRPRSSGLIGAALNRMARPRLEDEIHITVHIAETLSRQRYVMKLCRSLMSYGAPTHRLEEYLKMTARVLEIDGQFLYIPGCMIISFDDPTTHTTDVKLVRTTQGVDLGKLRDTHRIYKEVVHDKIGVEEATRALAALLDQPPKHPPWLLVLIYGLASACVGPFAFSARLIDLPIAFALGALLGVLQLIVAPKSPLYSNVFEISAAVLTSFLARAAGSVRGGSVFCFSALAQSAIALILPGYTVLCAALELQSKNMVAGSVRLVYAVVYSLFLGYGITVGTALYSLIDSKATSATTCSSQLPRYVGFAFVPPFTLCLIMISQAKWRQAPAMLLIAFAGYVVNFFSSRQFPGNAAIAQTLGALAIGVLANLYSRLRRGLAAAALLPAIFVQVPSGLAAGGSLVSGLSGAEQLKANTTTTTGMGGPADGVVFNVGYSMIQVAIGISVGLFLSALIVYPLGKRRSGLFSF